MYTVAGILYQEAGHRSQYLHNDTKWSIWIKHFNYSGREGRFKIHVVMLVKGSSLRLNNALKKLQHNGNICLFSQVAYNHCRLLYMQITQKTMNSQISELGYICIIPNIWNFNHSHNMKMPCLAFSYSCQNYQQRAMLTISIYERHFKWRAMQK